MAGMDTGTEVSETRLPPPGLSGGHLRSAPRSVRNPRPTQEPLRPWRPEPEDMRADNGAFDRATRDSYSAFGVVGR